MIKKDCWSWGDFPILAHKELLELAYMHNRENWRFLESRTHYRRPVKAIWLYEPARKTVYIKLYYWHEEKLYYLWDFEYTLDYAKDRFNISFESSGKSLSILPCY